MEEDWERSSRVGFFGGLNFRPKRDLGFRTFGDRGQLDPLKKKLDQPVFQVV